MSRPKLSPLDRLLEAFAGMTLTEMEDSMRSLNAMHRAAIRAAVQSKKNGDDEENKNDSQLLLNRM